MKGGSPEGGFCAVGPVVEVLGVGPAGAPVEACDLSISTSPNCIDTSCCGCGWLC